MRPRFKQLIAPFLLGVFLVFLIPKELVHELCWHQDTKESVCLDGTNSINTHHIHCLWLSYEASLFDVEADVVCPKSFDHTFAFEKIKSVQPAEVFATFPSLRGPPLS